MFQVTQPQELAFYSILFTTYLGTTPGNHQVVNIQFHMFRSSGLLVITTEPTAESTSCGRILSFYILLKYYLAI
jgi:hypothetical protein